VNLRARLALVIPVIFAAACTGSLFQSKAAPPTIYKLSGAAAPAAGAAAAAPIPVDLAVLKPSLSPGLETDRIAVLYPDRHLDYFAAARWTGPLGDVLQDLAVREFRARANLQDVSGDASVFTSAYWLEIEVMDFQAEYTSAETAPRVRVRFQARVGNSGDRSVLGHFTAGAEQPAAANNLTSIVDAYARAADLALADVVAHTEEVLVKNSKTR